MEESEITVGVVVFDKNGQIVLVKRRDPPAAGLWTLPMGHVEKNETLEEAAIREVLEETGLEVNIFSKLGFFQHSRVELTVFLAGIKKGVLLAGDDAVDVKLVSPNKVNSTSTNIHNPTNDHWAYQMHNEIIDRLSRLENLKSNGSPEL